jgi:subtilisin-like proprotein convertase family protein
MLAGDADEIAAGAGEFGDRFEFNDSIAAATVLGSETEITERDLSIDNIEDEDFFKVTAHSTGKLAVRIYFDDEGGDLNLQVQDVNGMVIASSTGAVDDEEIIIPVVGQQMYFVRVFGVGTVDNDYDLEIENFPAPVPTGVHLDPLSDTGGLNNDNVTSDTTPTIFIQTDVLDFVDSNGSGLFLEGTDAITALNPGSDGAFNDPANEVFEDENEAGIAVEVTFVNTTNPLAPPVTGFAQPVVESSPEVYRFTPTTPLAPGVYFITARTRVFDGQDTNPALIGIQRATGRSSASPPLWVTISGDAPLGGTMALLASSDTGMSNNDNVTNKMQPAFSGVGPINSALFVFAQAVNAAGAPVGTPLLVGSGTVGSDATDGTVGNGVGLWEVTVEPMADGKYNFFTRFETAAGVLGDAVANSLQFTNTTSAPIPNNGGMLDSTIQVAASVMGNITDLNVTLNITHPIDEELDIFLIAPNGTEIELSTDNGAFAANYTNTTFDDAAMTSIMAGAAPFTGTFRPEESLAQLAGQPIAGTWTLRVLDDSPGGGEFPAAGDLLNWSLGFQSPLMVLIDTVAPNTPFLDLLDDTGRHDNDNITKDTTPSVSMTTSDLNSAIAQMLFTDNLKFRIYDRFENGAAEVLIYDSAQDPAADAVTTPGDMFTSLTQLTRILPFLTPATPAIVGGTLANGVHNLKLEVEDRAGNISEDFLVQITVDAVPPPVSFGLPDAASMIDGLHAESDTGSPSVPATAADRVTSDTTPRLWGRAEADSIVRVWLDTNANGGIDLATDTFLGQAVAIPFDGNDAYPDGFWELTSVRDLNQIAGLPLDGLRRLLVTAEDVAGNPMPMDGVIRENVDELQIFIDTQGPRIESITPNGSDFDLFDPKPLQNGPTPMVNSLKIALSDLPLRLNQTGGSTNDFLYDAILEELASNPGNFLLIGDHVGQVPIQSVTVMNAPLSAALTAVASASQFTAASLIGADIQVGDFVLFTTGTNDDVARQVQAFNAATGQITVTAAFLNVPAVGELIRVADTEANARTAADAMIILNFFTPLPDDRFTLTVRDNIVDPAGNRLDGESNSIEPLAPPFFPTGNLIVGGSFVARFTVDSRPEIGTFVAKDIDIDINGNFVWDPANVLGNDATNVDLSFTLPVANADGSIGLGGYNVHDLVFAGKFRPNVINGGNGQVGAGGAVEDGLFFDQLAAYGYSAELGAHRWIIDTNSDGVVRIGTDIITIQPTLGNFYVPGALPIAGNFDNNATNGDEIGLYFSGQWALDTNRNFIIDGADTFVSNNLFGHPIVGDFDGDGLDDFAVFNNNTFSFNLANDGLFDANDASMVWGFPGVLDRPIAADMDQDGIDDIGLWVPRTSASLPRPIAEWYFLLSNDFSAAGVPAVHTPGTIVRLNHAFTPTPFGKDLFAEFGDERSLPIVGNFDPPVASSASPGGGPDLPGDYNRDRRVGANDRDVWVKGFGSNSNMTADGNRDGGVNAADYVLWRKNLGTAAASSSSANVAAGSSAELMSSVPSVGVENAAGVPMQPALTTGTKDTSNRTAVVDSVFGALGRTEAVRSAYRPLRKGTFVADNDSLLLMAELAAAGVKATDREGLAASIEGPRAAELTDELLAESAGVGGLFEPF